MSSSNFVLLCRAVCGVKTENQMMTPPALELIWTETLMPPGAVSIASCSPQNHHIILVAVLCTNGAVYYSTGQHSEFVITYTHNSPCLTQLKQWVSAHGCRRESRALFVLRAMNIFQTLAQAPTPALTRTEADLVDLPLRPLTYRTSWWSWVLICMA